MTDLVAERGRALSESAPLRYLTFGALYAAQGIPEGLTFFAIPAWLALNGVGAAPIGGYLAIITLPWSLKLFAGPFMDRFSYLPMGRRRPWVLFGQLGLVISFLSMTLIPDPVHHITWLMVAGFTVSFFGAFQDVATDGMAIDIIPQDQQARANGLMWGAKVTGTAASLAAGTWLINNMGFEFAVAALSITIFLIMWLPLLLRERPGEKRMPWNEGEPSPEAIAMKVESWGEILFTLKSAFILRSSLIMGLIVFVFTVAIGQMDGQLPLFTIQELGWTNDAYSNVLATSSVVGAFAAMAVAGWLVDRFGKVRIMAFYLVLMVVLVASMAVSRPLWSTTGYTSGLIFGYQTLYTFCMVAHLATAMGLCWKRVAATQFTLFMALGNMGRATGSALLGPLRARFDWPGMYLFFAATMALVLLLTWALRLKEHGLALEELEREFQSSRKPGPAVSSEPGGPPVPR